MVDKRTPHVYVEFEAKFGELWATRTLRETWWTREQFTFMWNLRQNLESSGHQEKYKSHTSVGRKFAPVEGLSHDLVCTGSIYHVHFAWQVWHGQLSPRFKFNKLKSFSGVEIDQNHVDKRILGGKGFAVGRLKRHNFCPASELFTLVSALGVIDTRWLGHDSKLFVKMGVHLPHWLGWTRTVIKTLLTFQYTGWFMGIFKMAYIVYSLIN